NSTYIDIISPANINNIDKEDLVILITPTLFKDIVMQLKKLQVQYIFNYMCIETYEETSINSNDLVKEIYWAQIYNSTIVDSKWLFDKSISPGRWAVGYNFLYVLYRILNDICPKKILELGLGQSTKLTTQFIKYHRGKHIVVEHDKLWANFFCNGWNNFSPETVIEILPLNQIHKNDKYYYGYRNFNKKFNNEKFELILIDGPFGGENYSRRDIIDCLPAILCSDFILLFDDSDRIGEMNTISEIEDILVNNGIKYFKGVYTGEKDKAVCVLTSKKYKFICSL
ncbi:hypothetical protein, partial [Pectinatus frisingensis]|uniref:hypothetical protein n=1 Tax=Pectinatus frisingensis TaxID=865 RepID=UPI0018C63EB1